MRRGGHPGEGPSMCRVLLEEWKVVVEAGAFGGQQARKGQILGLEGWGKGLSFYLACSKEPLAGSEPGE